MLPITDTPSSAGTIATTLVTSHSFGFSRREWIEVADLLSDRYRTVAVDAPGFGDAADVPGYSMQEMAAQFAETINALDLQRYVLVGHSMTGKVMSILASRAGAQLGLAHPPEQLVLLTPTPLGREVGGEDLRRSLLAQTKTRANAERFVADRSALPLPAEVFAAPPRTTCGSTGPHGRPGSTKASTRTGSTEPRRSPSRPWSSPPTATPCGGSPCSRS